MLRNYLCGVGLGASLMYFLDPNKGRRRRALAVDQLTRLMHEGECALDVARRDAVNRTQGILAETRSAMNDEPIPDDRVLSERVRSQLGRIVSHPHAINVIARSGKI